MIIMTIKECIEHCEKKRIENTKAYRDSIRKANISINDYELRQAKVYRDASSFVVR